MNIRKVDAVAKSVTIALALGLKEVQLPAPTRSSAPREGTGSEEEKKQSKVNVTNPPKDDSKSAEK